MFQFALNQIYNEKQPNIDLRHQKLLHVPIRNLLLMCCHKKLKYCQQKNKKD